MIKAIRYLLVLAFVVSLGACRNAPLENVDRKLHAYSSPTIEEIGDMIAAVATARGWQAEKVRPGVINAKLIRAGGKHTMDVRITYDTKVFSITYMDSHNMNYGFRGGKARIHPRYNTWVDWLADDIQARSRKL